MRRWLVSLLPLVSWGMLSTAQTPSARTFDVYVIDVEGGEATLFVSPSGVSLLVDTGWPGFDGRDADRILVAARQAGITQSPTSSPEALSASRPGMASLSSLCGQSASDSEDPPHARVSEVDTGAVHHRAGTSDHADIVLAAVLDCVRRDTRSLPYGLVHPDAVDSGIAAVAHDPLGGLRSRDDHDCVDSTRD
jgi:hypothetical protein